MNTKTWLFIPLIIIGATWGLTIPAIKVAVSGGYPVLGVLFWQVFLAAIVALITKKTNFKVNTKEANSFWLDHGIWNNLARYNNLLSCIPSSSWCNGHHDSYGSNIHNANSYFDRA